MDEDLKIGDKKDNGMPKIKVWIKGTWVGKGRKRIWREGHYRTVTVSNEEYLRRKKKILEKIFG